MEPLAPSHQRVLERLGQDLSLARRRRRMTQASIAERAGVSLSTVRRLEQGDEGVALGAVLRILGVFGMQDHLENLADAQHDQTGMALIHASLPIHGRTPAPRRVRKAKQNPADFSGAM